MAPERLGQLEVPALGEEMQVEIAEQRAEGIGILGLLHGAGPVDAQEIGAGSRHRSLEQPGDGAGRQLAHGLPVVAAEHLDRVRAGQEGANDAPALALVRAEHREGVERTAGFQSLRRRAVEPTGRRHGVHALSCDAVPQQARRQARAGRDSGIGSQAGRFAAS